MSIGIYAFLSIYFLSFGLSAFAQFRTHCPPSSDAAVPIAQRVQRLGVCVVPCVVRPGSGAVFCVAFGVPQSVLVRCGLWSPPAGHTAAAQPRPVSLSTAEKIKKAQKITPTLIANLKNFPQKQKDPYKGSVFCAILALQALKGRNLQWLKVK